MMQSEGKEWDRMKIMRRASRKLEDNVCSEMKMEEDIKGIIPDQVFRKKEAILLCTSSSSSTSKSLQISAISATALVHHASLHLRSRPRFPGFSGHGTCRPSPAQAERSVL